MLTGYDIDVYRELDNEDVSLDEFKDRIDGWIIDKLKSIGCDTVKSTLALSADELAKRSDLEIETAQEIINILQSENEDVELDEFRDEIDEQIIDKLKQTGLSTAKSVIDQPIDEAGETDRSRRENPERGNRYSEIRIRIIHTSLPIINTDNAETIRTRKKDTICQTKKDLDSIKLPEN